MTLTIEREAFEDIMRTMSQLKKCLDIKLAEKRQLDMEHKRQLQHLAFQLLAAKASAGYSKDASRTDSVPDQMDLLRKENDSLRKQISQESLEDSHVHGDSVLKSRMNELQVTNSQLQAELQRAQDLFQRQKCELETIVSIRNSQSGIKADHEKWLQETCRSLESSNRHLQSRVADLETQLRDARKKEMEYECLATKAQIWGKDCESLRRTLAEQEDEMRCARGRLTEMAQKYEEAVKDNDKQREEIVELKITIHQLERQRAALQASAAEEQTYKADRRYESSKSNAEIERLSAEVARLREELFTATRELEGLRIEKIEQTARLSTQETLTECSREEQVRLIKHVRTIATSSPAKPRARSRVRGRAEQEIADVEDTGRLRSEIKKLQQVVQEKTVVDRRQKRAFWAEPESVTSLPKLDFSPPAMPDSEESADIQMEYSDDSTSDEQADSWFNLLKERMRQLTREQRNEDEIMSRLKSTDADADISPEREILTRTIAQKTPRSGAPAATSKRKTQNPEKSSFNCRPLNSPSTPKRDYPYSAVTTKPTLKPKTNAKKKFTTITPRKV